MKDFFQTFRTTLKYGLKTEIMASERLIAMAMFAIGTMLLMAFALNDIFDRAPSQAGAASVFVTGFFTMQLAFLRVFEPEENDRAFDLIALKVSSPAAWYTAKVSVATLLGSILIYMVHILLFGMFQSPQNLAPSWGSLLLILLTTHSMASLGILLATMTLRINARQILFPILYFPLTIPILLAAIQSWVFLASGQGDISSLWSSWLGLIIVFDLLFFSLGLLFYNELLKSP
jgi:heme exporter protein B